MTLCSRGLLPLLRARLQRWPITATTGARQTGKTTLVRDLLPRAGGPKDIYFSLHDPDERLHLAAHRVRHLDHGKQLVILDEIQKQPALLDGEKLLADRKQGHRFLLLGSSQIFLLQKVRETLAARVALLEVWPLALVERVEGPQVPRWGLDVIWLEREDAVEKLATTKTSADEMHKPLVLRVWAIPDWRLFGPAE